MSEAVQIPLDLGHRTALADTDFMAAGCNEEALGWISRWPAWPDFALVLCGPAGCGKSHLAQIFQRRAAGRRIEAAELTVASVPQLAEQTAVVVEDADRGVDETALFHLYNLLREKGRFLLMTGRTPPSRWSIALPDLRSRLLATAVVGIGAPDDTLLEALLLKLFADRQLRVGPEVPAFLLPRMERSFAGAQALVEAIDTAALTEGRAVTIPLLRRLLGSFPEAVTREGH